MTKRKLILAIDFDGTIVENKYPNIGKLKPHAKAVINNLIDNHNCEIIIWTCREDTFKQNVIDFLNENHIKFHQINNNIPELVKKWNDCNCRKVFADIYIDDKGIFTPHDFNWLVIENKVISYKIKYHYQFI